MLKARILDTSNGLPAVRHGQTSTTTTEKMLLKGKFTELIRHICKKKNTTFVRVDLSKIALVVKFKLST